MFWKNKRRIVELESLLALHLSALRMISEALGHPFGDKSGNVMDLATLAVERLRIGAEARKSDSREVFDIWARLAPAYEFAVQHAAARLIAEERRRQIETEGWSAEHDDAYAPGTLLAAGRAYAQHAQKQLWNQCGPDTGPPAMWPFAEERWRPSADPLRNTQKSAALIAAEMDARMRASNRAKA